jgi:hypothetical protein
MTVTRPWRLFVLWSDKLEPKTRHIRSKQMTKKAIKDLPKKGTKGSELKLEDLDKVTGGIGGIATRISEFANENF